jgi:YidC/Oxa1 family membrane protein insertase
MENKNTILALILMLLVWTGFTFLFPPQDDESSSPQTEKHVYQQTGNTENVKLESPDNSSDSHGLGNTDISEVSGSNGYTTSGADEFVDFENDFYTIQFNKRGGVISSVELSQYRQENSPEADKVSLLDREHEISSLYILSGSGFGLNGNEVYEVTQRSVNNQDEVIFEARLDNDIRISKVFRFLPDSYLVNVQVDLVNESGTTLQDGVQIALNNFWDESFADNRFDYIGFTSYVDGELHEDEVKEITSASKTYTQEVSWSGYTTKYFLSALVDTNGVFDAVSLERDGKRISNIAHISDLSIGADSKVSFSFDVYLGPKDVDYLSTAGENLTEVVDFGFFSFLSKPLHLCLNFFYDYVHNYGVAIIILTLIIKLLFWPLTQKSYASMKAMQTLQPEMKKLREKYRGDKEGLNRSMMELYKKHRVNPLGGCLPMLVQIPVFIALYKVLLSTIELRHAPFALWITDLSVKDPYYITPVIMGITMFIQQKMTPSTMDPLQAKMMLAMPVVFTFIFLNFPSGLVLYWLVNNILTIFQQYLIYRKPAVAQQG